jgi:chromosome segregation ATPase
MDNLVERLMTAASKRDGFDAVFLASEAANEITRLRARVEALEEERDKDHKNINLKADFIERTINQLAAAEAQVTALTAQLATARADAYEQAAQVVDARKSIIEVGTELSSRIRALKDAKP